MMSSRLRAVRDSASGELVGLQRLPAVTRRPDAEDAVDALLRVSDRPATG